MIKMSQILLECSWNILQMPFDISPFGMQLESFEHDNRFHPPKRMGTNILSAVESFSKHLECPGMAKDFF